MESPDVRNRLEAIRQQALIRREVVATLRTRSAQLRRESDRLIGRRPGTRDDRARSNQ